MIAGKPRKLTASFSIQRLAYYMICLCIVLSVLYVGRSFFIPIIYGIFFAFMLKPICDWFEAGVKNRVVAIILTLLTVFLTLGGIFTFFIIEIMDVVSEADGIVTNIQNSAFDLFAYVGSFLGMRERESFALLNEQIAGVTSAPISLLTSGLSTSGTMLTNFSLIVIYTFFFLLYSTALRQFLLGQLRGSKEQEGQATIKEVQEVAKNYLGGMLTVMLILGVLNSLGLWVIGVRFPLVWGFLGAMLAIIPYVGTFIGGLLPFLYAVATLDSFWQPVAVIILYMTVQSFEGNFITPKVVGNSVKINALAAILSLIFGALFWGLAGVILAIPLLAMLRVVLAHIDATKPVALLLSDDLYAHADLFSSRYNRDRYRLRSLFKSTKPLDGGEVPSLLTPPGDQISQADTQVITDAEPK
ncbi:AI-2E family transporter [Neolewinella antarctica]|uniref:PurR-regulated permease PerM n=1 Tax=Neolewinella antarctica TaxID=442734 RepID=A0ABX0X6K4_9BACT|nr:AI-2E family transporter [Neolewinella antarctica]NJC24695.1 putative PurR-regulated permease PerM [Neolewinella antarctica]